MEAIWGGTGRHSSADKRTFLPEEFRIANESVGLSRNDTVDNRYTRRRQRFFLMTRSLDPSEEYILAAFLSGELPEHLRREIITYLAGHDRARDLLAMAQEAMDAAESGDGASRNVAPELRIPVSGGQRWAPSDMVSERNMWKITAFFAGAVLVLAIIVAVVALNTSRLQDSVSERSWVPVVNGEDVVLEWEAVPGASDYHLMRYDPASRSASIIAASDLPSIDMGDLEGASLTGSDPIWVLAFGPAGELLDRSHAIRLRSTD